VAHAASVAEARGEAERLVHAQLLVIVLDDGADQHDVFATAAGPALVETVGRHKNRRLACEGSETLPSTGVVGSGVHVATVKMRRYD
jgi:hypothetical protein